MIFTKEGPPSIFPRCKAISLLCSGKVIGLNCLRGGHSSQVKGDALVPIAILSAVGNNSSLIMPPLSSLPCLLASSLRPSIVETRDAVYIQVRVFPLPVIFKFEEKRHENAMQGLPGNARSRTTIFVQLPDLRNTWIASDILPSFGASDRLTN